MVKILIADDHHLVRQGFRALLEEEADFELVGECDNGRDVLRRVDELEPDLVLLDLKMPGLNGLEVTRQIRKGKNAPRVIILSMYADEAYVGKALQNGAAGYVLKDCKRDELVRAIREALVGRHYLSAPLADRSVQELVDNVQTNADTLYEALTTREREVLQLAAEGYGNKEIGERLFISPRTVETHRANFMRKLNLQSQADVVRYAVQRGILTVDPGA